jgi:signal transduction histidine kinase
MLQSFIADNRGEILAQAGVRATNRCAPPDADTGRPFGLPVFLDQLVEALGKVRLREAVNSADIEESAGHYGDDLFRQGLSVAQVINSYGDLCQVITGLAADRHTPIPPGQFQTLNLCLDLATSGAVTAFSNQREKAITDDGTERLGILAHEMRNALNTAMLSFASIRKGTVASGGSTGMIHQQSLLRMNSLINRSLADVRLDAGVDKVERVPLWEIFEEVEIGAFLVAQTQKVHFTVTSVDPAVSVDVDRQILAAAVANLLHNAFKFTQPGTTVRLRADIASMPGRVLIEVEDQCGGLPGNVESLLLPFTQQGTDRSGLGLGLSICAKAAKAMGGEVRVRDLPGKGCVFTIDLPRQPAST